MSLGASTSSATSVPRQDNSNGSEVEPLLWSPSSDYGTDDHEVASINLNEPRDSIQKRQIGVLSAVFLIFNRVIGVG